MATLDEEIDEIEFLLKALEDKRAELEKADKYTTGKINDFLKNRLSISGNFNIGLIIKKMRTVCKP